VFGSKREPCRYWLRSSGPDGAVFDRGKAWIGTLFGLAIASGIGGVWVHRLIHSKPPLNYLHMAGVVFIAFIGMRLLLSVTLVFELRTDVVGGRIKFRDRRLWGSWHERWSIESAEVVEIRLDDKSVTLELADFQTFTVDSGDQAENLRVLADHLAAALRRSLKKTTPDE
jgi:hypothetical protein